MLSTKDYLSALKLLAKKRFGQHFLIHEQIIEKIVQDFPEEKKIDGIVEIGPGPGVLTRHLANKGKPFWGIEKDKDFQEILLPFFKSGELFIEDALLFDWPSFLEKNKMTDSSLWLVSNLPYNVSVPLTIHFFKTKQIKHLTLMFQKEVADKFLPKQNKKMNWMNSLFVLSHTYYDVKKIAMVKPSSFLPPPKVDSLVLSFSKKERPLLPFSSFLELERFCKIIFKNKRKQLKKNLQSTFKNIDFYHQFLEQEKLPLTVRGEELKLESVINLFHSYKKNQEFKHER